jgi:hypothetical protein
MMIAALVCLGDILREGHNRYWWVALAVECEL